MKSVFIAGCGDIGERIAGLCCEKKVPVAGLVRSVESIKRLQQADIEPVQVDLATGGLSALPTTTATIFYLVPPPGEGENDPLIRRFLSAISTDALPEKLVLLSTTAVYGDCQGQWINETRPVNPQTARGRRRLDAEQAAQEWSASTGVPIIILRVGGIYGPGRLPIERIKKGLPILHEADSPYTNRIHQDDLAQVCIAAAERGKPGEVYNVSDGQPGTMSRYFKDIAQAYNLPMPPEISLEEAQQVMSAGMLSYLKESRRLGNRKMLAELGVVLQYVSLEIGLVKR
ncbi:MAG TPA: SDR family oxidoreductase [Gammaproteobacteria bacterium]|nr:SDR family oxidoreductase [Gammaproteobacteria bacterium]